MPALPPGTLVDAHLWVAHDHSLLAGELDIVRCTREVWQDESTSIYIMSVDSWIFGDEYVGMHVRQRRATGIYIKDYGPPSTLSWTLQHEMIHQHIGDPHHADTELWFREGLQQDMHDAVLECSDRKF